MTAGNRIRAALVLSLIVCLSAFGGQVGRETPVTESGCAAQQDVVVSRDSSRTLIAFDEAASEGQPSRVVLHRYDANTGVLLGRETFAVQSSTHHQRRPAFGRSMIAWVEEDPNGTAASLWWQALNGYTVGSGYEPDQPAERVAEVAPGTQLAILNTHVFHVIVWTSPDGRLKGVLRSLTARIGYDPSPFYVTTEVALHPSAGVPWSSVTPLIAYNYEIPPELCAGPCPPPRYGIRATVISGVGGIPVVGNPSLPIDIAPAGASAPRVVFNEIDFVVFWSMDDGGTFAQRVSTSGGVPVRIGEPQQVAEGSLHDAAPGPDEQYSLVMTDAGGARLTFLRLASDLSVIESIPFHARLTGAEKISLSGDEHTRPMLAYAVEDSNDCTSSQAVLREVEENVTPRKRRSVR